jgi:hypothetical protein
VDELLQALDVAVVKELLLEVGPRRLGSGTLWRCHSYITRSDHLPLAVGSWCKFSPSYIRVEPGTETASEECSQAQISVAEAIGIPGEPEGIRRGLIIESIPRVQGQAEVGRAEASEERSCLGGHARVFAGRSGWTRGGLPSI